ncbi:DUF349 domain-containing protein [Amniculibacterium aquaticum]|uniref:DUF349 domain-containing protein n=1 Tax=Amniculibacterium aquaticum TaxID=2479858 RepID=UPI000F59C914|nr:DUF349 domain-containing protein [Amniculibacterium aquaticum]
MITESNFSENEENKPQQEHPNNDQAISENTPETSDVAHDEVEHTTDARSVGELVDEMEKLINQPNAGAESKAFNHLKNLVKNKVADEKEVKKHEFEAEHETDESFSWEHPLANKISGILHIFHEKHQEHLKHQEELHQKHREERHEIIERLKRLNANSEPGVNLFKEIREIKKMWTEAGQVSKSDFNTLNNDYFHHLNQFYQMLDMHKEFLEQEYSHNLEKRLHIIERAKELESESSVQKALNELQYLHRLWKEEAEPVAEEFREKTWEEFKTVSNKIHERKAELTAQIEAEQLAHLEKKNDIISQMNAVLSNQEKGHQYWQNAIKKIEELRSEFLKTGNVPRRLSNENWNAFKVALKDFNSAKNNFYKSLKSNQLKNLEDKLALIKIAKDNMLTEDWEMALPLYKKLQDDWKKIGHVPRNMTDKTWADFREACNGFFNNYREKKKATGDNWKENFKLKTQLLADLKAVSDGEGSVEKIEAIKTEWNAIGKVPREKMNINSEFNKVLREKLKLNKINEFELKEEGLSGAQLTDKARKMKNQIAELESEITTLENNLGFFSNPSRENPLLTDTYNKIDEKKELLESMKVSLHQMIAGE